MLSIPFFSDHDAAEMAYAAWMWDTDHGLTDRSWEQVKDRYRERADFEVEVLNRRMCTS
jgi:hypothetical protein